MRLTVGATRVNRIVSIPVPSLVQCQIVPAQWLAQPMAMPLAVVRSWEEQDVLIMGQASGCFRFVRIYKFKHAHY